MSRAATVRALRVTDGSHILSVNGDLTGTAVESLRDYSNVLKAMKPGDKVSITYLREGKEITTKAVLAGR